MLFLRTETIAVIVLIALSFSAFYYLVTSDVSALYKGLAAVLLLLVTGLLIRRVTGAEGWNGFIMVKTKEGVRLVDYFKERIGKYWDATTDMGLVLGFGLSSKLAFPHISIKLMAVSLVLLAIYTFIITPYLPIIAISIIDLPRADQMSGDAGSIAGILAVMAVFGFVGIVILSLLGKAVSVLLSLFAFLMGDPTALTSTAPGVQFIIPGLTLPLVEGIVALLVILIVHEGGHGVSARLSKIKIKSTGFLTFGFIPVGAFVDIDEKQLDRAKAVDKARVAAAGSTGNLATTLVFFIPTIIMLSALPMFFAPQLTIAGLSSNLSAQYGPELTVGTRITYINGVEVNSLSDYLGVRDTIKPGDDVLVTTAKGTTSLRADANGRLGLLLTQPIKEEFWYVKSLYTTLGLITVLNFFIGVINLLPIAAFDGYRLFDVGLRNGTALRIISYVVMAAFFLNIVPWFWS